MTITLKIIQVRDFQAVFESIVVDEDPDTPNDTMSLRHWLQRIRIQLESDFLITDLLDDQYLGEYLYPIYDVIIKGIGESIPIAIVPVDITGTIALLLESED